jgi:hypothetical protein
MDSSHLILLEGNPNLKLHLSEIPLLQLLVEVYSGIQLLHLLLEVFLERLLARQ